MDPRIALVIFFVVLIVLWILIRNYNIKPVSAFALSLLISLILLGFMYNPMEAWTKRQEGATQLYGIIVFLSFVFFFLYIIYMALKDKDTGATQKWMPWS